jgi:predicted AlkP superfamily phosphohydrolase/phosphomutase
MTAQPKLLILGIDGMDPVLLSRFLDRLPNLKALAAATGKASYESVFPPDSVPAWVSFFTGLNPAEHGVLEYVDYLSSKTAEDPQAEIFHGHTFWDRASRAGCRVAVINPFLAYPPWPVAGVMSSGPAFVKGRVMTSPGDYAEQIPLPFMGGYEVVPSEGDLAGFLDRTEQDTRSLMDYALKVMADQNPDLAFVSFLTLDRIQHFMWRYTDPQDPTYPGKTEFADSIFRFYLLMDEVVGALRAQAGSGTRTLVMSDHGHGRRCTRLINVNEILRQEKWLVCQGGAQVFSSRRVMEQLKNAVLAYAHQWHLEKILQKVVKRIPNKKALKRGDHIIDKARSLAYLSDFDGANPFGGICLTAAAHAGGAYEAHRTRILGLLTNLHQPAGLSRPVVRWAKRREEVYAGAHLGKYPDVVFELEPEYGVNWSLFAPPVVPNPRHRTLSGGHLKPGVLLVSDPPMAQGLSGLQNPMTLHRQVLAWLGLHDAAAE